jgi:ABC-type transport system involved in multi-copper enzyme maturation permease subunit
MIRATWMQFRTQVGVGIGGLLVVGVILAVTGPHLVHLYDTNVATCAAHGDCSSATSLFLRTDHALQVGFNVLVVVVPGLIGIFWGAPLVARELETGTYRLAWTQSVTRTRWLAVKLGCVGLASMVVAGLFSLMVTWWFSPIDRAYMTPFSTFDQRGIVVVGYAAFAFALGVTAGVLIRRTVPAIVATLGAFVTLRLLEFFYLQPYLITPSRHSYKLALGSTISGYGGPFGQSASLFPGTPNLPNAWILSTDIVDKTGHPLTGSIVNNLCPQLATALGGPGPGAAENLHSGRVAAIGPAPAAAQQVLRSCISTVGATYREVVTYQPGSHYWPLQGCELALYLVAALILGGVCLWRIGRHLA